ncbi:MAG: RNA polymerase sigma factor [Marinifilaceae bacterium]
MSTTDKEIINAIKHNLEQGFRLLMSKYKEAIYWHIRRIVISHIDAQDATQEAFIRIFRALNQFNSNSSIKTWIYKIATNEALRILSKYKEPIVSLDCTTLVINNIKADEYVDYSDLEGIKLQKAISLLPTKQQITFNLRYYDEMEYDEIAKITDTSSASAKANYHFAKEKIVHYMNSNN